MHCVYFWDCTVMHFNLLQNASLTLWNVFRCQVALLARGHKCIQGSKYCIQVKKCTARLHCTKFTKRWNVFKTCLFQVSRDIADTRPQMQSRTTSMQYVAFRQTKHLGTSIPHSFYILRPETFMCTQKCINSRQTLLCNKIYILLKITHYV